MTYYKANARFLYANIEGLLCMAVNQDSWALQGKSRGQEQDQE